MMNPFANKKVAIIGNASIVDMQTVLDTCDIIVRCNCWKPCDVLFWDGQPEWSQFERDLGSFHGPRFMYINGMRDDARDCAGWCMGEEIEWDYYSPPGDKPILDFPELDAHLWWPAPLQRGLGCRPLTGFMAIYRALQLDAERVFVTGMDLYRSSQTGLLPLKVGPHDITDHLHWLGSAIISANGRLLVDATLRQIILGFWPQEFLDALPHP